MTTEHLPVTSMSCIAEYLDANCCGTMYTLVSGEVLEGLVQQISPLESRGAFDQFAINHICREAGSEFRILNLGKVEDGSPTHRQDQTYIIVVARLLNALLEGFIAPSEDYEVEVCKSIKALALSQTNLNLVQDARR